MPGTKRQVVVHGEGTPLGLTISGANRNDAKMLEPTLDAIPPVRGRRGRPRRRPDTPHADRGYDHRFRRLAVRYERREDIHLAVTTATAALICISQISRFG